MPSRFFNGVTRARPYWLLISIACLVPATLNVFTTYLNARLGRGTVDWGAITFSGTLWLSFGVLSPITYILARRFPLRRNGIGRTVAAHLGGALVLCFAWTTIGVLLAFVLNSRPRQETFSRYFSSWLLVNLPWSVFLYFAVLGCVFAFTYYREARERESHEARLAAQLAEAKLSALRMQLNPHFLFNSLNAITVLVRDHKVQEASRMLELLSGVLRQVLHSEERQEVTLDEELRFIDQYLAIEQVRFSDRLQVKRVIDPAVRDVTVPGFILQPLVENAVRHGVAKRSHSGLIELRARESNGDLVLSVHDNGPGYSPGPNVGVGLANTRARLETLFGEAGELRVVNDDGGTIALVRFPLKRPLKTQANG